MPPHAMWRSLNLESLNLEGGCFRVLFSLARARGAVGPGEASDSKEPKRHPSNLGGGSGGLGGLIPEPGFLVSAQACRESAPQRAA